MKCKTCNTIYHPDREPTFQFCCQVHEWFCEPCHVRSHNVSDNVSETQIREAVKQAVPDANEIEKRMDKMMNQPSDLVLDSDNVSEDSE